VEGSAQERHDGEGDAPPQTFVFADLAGYTALTEAHGDERAADVAASFTGEVRALLDDYDADEVKSIGDALMLHTADARVALHLAARIAGEFGSRHHSLGVRVGMHTGTAVERDGDWFGGAVNLAARVAAAAGPGEVLLTGATAEAAGAERGQLALSPRGRQRFHNVSEPVEVFALTAEGDSGEGPLPVDPVCRMAVDPARARERVVHRGVEYHFCSAQCASAFSAAPDRYSRALSRRADLLVSDRAREGAAERIGRAYRKGRLSADDLEDRAARVWAARTRGELRAVTHDLPSRHRRRPFPYGVFRWATWPLRRMMQRLRGRR
jgi:class 3 adenylate cyclase/YHS domain-containing protein